MRAGELRRWVEARRSVEEFERSAAAGAIPPGQAWEQALSLFALLGRMVGWPVAPDEVRRREEAASADAWKRLRAGLENRP
jgi:hypothetical protein